MTAAEILDALIAISDDRIWATELAFFSGARRIDFFTLEPTASQQFRASAYEIKVTRADYLRDSAEKQEGALKWSDRFWYVTPPDLIDPRELPDWAGLQEWSGSAFRVCAARLRLGKRPLPIGSSSFRCCGIPATAAAMSD